ncbi:MAG TPA: transporter substrate-binding domain-containing protein [Parvibaculum sp.]|jgi:polar amino acid transport system substrate-binding protein
MRLLFFINVLAIIVIAGALAHMYQGAPLPWKLTITLPPETVAPASSLAVPPAPEVLPNPDQPVTPVANPKRPAPTVSVQAPEAPAPGKLRVLTEGAYPPFNYRNGEGKLVGFDVDTALALCARLHLECVLETRAWSDLLPSLKRGEADAVIASMLIPSHGHMRPAADPDIVFSQAYYTTPGHFAARRDARIAGASAEALAGRRIVVQSGSTHEAFLRARFSESIILDVASLEIAESSLANGRADLIFADRNALLSWTADDKGGACCRLVGVDYADPVYFGEGAGVALRAGDEALLGRVDKALEEMKKDGTQKQIAVRYFGQGIR